MRGVAEVRTIAHGSHASHLPEYTPQASRRFLVLILLLPLLAVACAESSSQRASATPAVTEVLTSGGAPSPTDAAAPAQSATATTLVVVLPTVQARNTAPSASATRGVPTAAETVPPTPTKEKPPTPTTPKAMPTPAQRAQNHTISTGDTLYGISRRYGVSVEALAEANGLSPDAPLAVGQRLQIPAAGEVGGLKLPLPGQALTTPMERPLSQLAPGVVAFLRQRRGATAAAVYLPQTNTLYSYNSAARFEMASTVKVPIMVTQLARVYAANPDAVLPGTDLLTPMITVSDNDAATALLAQVGGPPAVIAELRARGVDDTEINPEAWGLSTTTAPDMALLMRSLYYGERLNPRLRDVAFRLMVGIVAEQRWGVPAGLAASSTVAFKGGWLPLQGGWLVHQTGIAMIDDDPVIFAFYNGEQPTFEYGKQTLRRIIELLSAGEET